MASTSKDILSRLEAGEVILGDGSYVVTLEKRGYVCAPIWTPEAACEHPEAVEQLAVEFGRAGCDVTQTFTYSSTDDKLPEGCKYKCGQINTAACEIARKVSDRFGSIMAGGVTQTHTYMYKKKDKQAVQEELRKAFEPLIENGVDLLILEYFRHCEEMLWAIELAKTYGKPLAATMCIGPSGDATGVPAGECAVRMTRAGADIVGVNCLFDPFITLETVKVMKAALDEEGLKPHLMAQPLGFRDPDGGDYGWIYTPEYPYAIEPRQITRFEARKFAREAYDLGVRVIGGCCGFESYHMRAMAEELRHERRGVLPEASQKSDYDLRMHKERSKFRPEYKEKGSLEYWMNLHPSTGRPMSRPLCDQPKPAILPRSAFR